MLPAPRSGPTSRKRRGAIPKLLTTVRPGFRLRTQNACFAADDHDQRHAALPVGFSQYSACPRRFEFGSWKPPADRALGDWRSEYRRGNQDESAQRNGRSGCRDGHQRNPAQHDSPSASVTDRWKCSNKAMGEPDDFGSMAAR